MNERTIFMAAVEIEDADKRSAYLNEACGDCLELRQRVEALISSHEEAGTFLQGNAQAALSTIDGPAVGEGEGTVIGKYKLLQEIGEGGMGTVFMAEQTVPVKRRVALKIIKQGMDTKQVIARFEAERQALAMMDHPNIAKVLDAGTTDSGRPYFAMELVKGIPITKYCDQHHSTPRERLQLFTAVCLAVQHAHQKGIIHRDLKPSNVLVAHYDDQPVVKVIDFGVAKATGQQLTEKTLFTRFGQVVGTLEYMSPEQARFNQLDIDTRSDIYSLGVLLYELLTGATPLDGDRLKTAAFEEVMRIIREEEPPKPSTRVSVAGSDSSMTVDRCSTEPGRLFSILRGDLDWLVMKALSKERDRRYETASGLAADIERYLDGDAIEARPPSAMYRLRKTAARHRVALAATALVLLVLLTGTGVSVWQRNEAVIARRDAVSQQRKAEAEAARADGEARTAQEAEEVAVAAREEAEEYLDELMEKQTENARLHSELLLAAARFLLVGNNATRAKELLGKIESELGDSDFLNDQSRRLRRQCQESISTPVMSGAEGPVCAALSPDGALVAVGDSANKTTVYRTYDGAIVHRLRGHVGWVRDVAFSPRDEILASASSDGTVRLWNTEDGEEIRVLRGDGKVRAIAFSPDGKTLAISRISGQVTLWMVDTDQRREIHEASDKEHVLDDGRHTAEPESISHLEFSADGEALAATIGRYPSDFGSNESEKVSELIVWDVKAGLPRFRHDGIHQGEWVPSERKKGPPPQFTFSPAIDANALACWGWEATRSVVLLDSKTGSVRVRLAESQGAHLATFSPNGRVLAASYQDGAVKMWDSATGKLLKCMKSPDGGPIYAITFSPRDPIIATGGADNIVRLWDRETGEELDQFYGHYQAVGYLVFSNDGRILMSRSRDRTTRAWRLQISDTGM